MGFLQVLYQFENEIINDACKEEKPETVLGKEYIANAFLEFVRNIEGEEDENYYLKWYEEENEKNSELSKIDFIYHNVLGIKEKMDISEEYLRLYDNASEYMSVLQNKKNQFENELRAIAKDKRKKNERDKIVFYKNEIEDRLKKRSLFDTKCLIEKAWRNCTIPSYMGWFRRDFSFDIYSAKNVDADKRNLIFLGYLPLKDAELMLALKKENRIKYSKAFETMIYSLDIVGQVKKIAENNYFINSRLPIISTALTLFIEKNYMSFVYLITPQIEGLFRVLQQSILGDSSYSSGMKELVGKIYKNEDFLEYVYFAYDFPEWRNKIAHGELVEVDTELACEIMMDLYWILNTIDSDKHDYKRIMIFLNDFCAKQDTKERVECLSKYFNSMEGDKYLFLLDRYFEGKFDKIFEWYGLEEQQQKFCETISSEELYLLIWDDEPLEMETMKEMEMVDGTLKTIKVMEINNNSLKYYRLLALLKKYDYVPNIWYQKYLSFAEQIDVTKEEVMRKIGNNFDGIEEELDEY